MCDKVSDKLSFLGMDGFFICWVNGSGIYVLFKMLKIFFDDFFLFYSNVFF